jgi:hypothetical protein
MTPLLLVVNAGSSSLKFALFKKDKADQPVADATGQVEGIGTQPRFTVENAAGQTLVDRRTTPKKSFIMAAPSVSFTRGCMSMTGTQRCWGSAIGSCTVGNISPNRSWWTPRF